MSLKLELSGSFSSIALYMVYMTRFDVKETISNTSKFSSSMKRVTSAANMRQMEGTNRECQNGPESLFKLMARLSVSGVTLVVQLVTSNLFNVWVILMRSPHGTSSICPFSDWETSS